MNSRPRKKIRLICLLISLTFFSCSGPPNFITDSGDAIHLNDLKGKWVVFNFWAEWCAPCIKEIPELNAFQRFLEQNKLDAKLFSVSFDKIALSDLAAVKAKLNMQYPLVLTEPNPILPFGMPSSLPAHIVVTPDGEIRGPILGQQNLESLKTLIGIKGSK